VLILDAFAATRLRLVMAFFAVAVAVGGLAGCDQISDETKDAGVTLACSQIQSEVGADPTEIENNPQTAKLVALIVRDIAPEENIRNIAAQVAEDPNALNPRVQLATWVDEKCRR
jgi:hypothetical protein